MTTMADIAKRAGVALSTVSYALSGKRPVSEETKRRIFTAIAELGYHPNALARGLVTKRTRVITLLFPSTKGLSEVQLEFVTSAAQVASERGYTLLLWTPPTEDQEILRLTQEGLMEGLILMEIKLKDPRVEMLRDLGYPFTMIGRCQENDGISFVDLDFEEAARLSVQHLADLGHRHIALLNFPSALLEAGYGPAVRFLDGFQAAVAERGLQGVARSCEPTLECGYETIQTLLEEHPSLSAVVTANDRIPAGVIQALHDKGVRIPNDFSIVAKVPSRIAEMMTPPLTAVDVPTGELGRIGAEMLIRQLEGEEEQPMQLVLSPKLTVRQSSGPYSRR